MGALCSTHAAVADIRHGQNARGPGTAPASVPAVPAPSIVDVPMPASTVREDGAAAPGGRAPEPPRRRDITERIVPILINSLQNNVHALNLASSSVMEGSAALSLDLQQDVADILVAAQNTRELVHDLLAITSLRDGTLAYVPDVVSIRQKLRDTVGQIMPLSQVPIHLTVAPDVPVLVCADAEMVSHILVDALALSARCCEGTAAPGAIPREIHAAVYMSATAAADGSAAVTSPSQPVADSRQRWLTVEVLDNGAPLGAGVTSKTIMAALNSSADHNPLHPHAHATGGGGGGAAAAGADGAMASRSAASARAPDAGAVQAQAAQAQAAQAQAAQAQAAQALRGVRAQRTALVLPVVTLLADAIGGTVQVGDVLVPASTAVPTACRVVRFAVDFPFTLPSEAERATAAQAKEATAFSAETIGIPIIEAPLPLPWGAASRRMGPGGHQAWAGGEPENLSSSASGAAPAAAAAANTNILGPATSVSPESGALEIVVPAVAAPASNGAGGAAGQLRRGGGGGGGGRAPRAVVGLDGQPLGMHVLLVDDMGVIRRQGEVFLEQLGCTAVTREDGDEVEGALHESTRPFDAIVLDIGMTRTDGAEVCRALRSDLGVRCPIIAMTGHVSSKDLLRYYAMGFDVVLPKPFTRDALGRALVEARQRRGGNTRIARMAVRVGETAADVISANASVEHAKAAAGAGASRHHLTPASQASAAVHPYPAAESAAAGPESALPTPSSRASSALNTSAVAVQFNASVPPAVPSMRVPGSVNLSRNT